MEEEDNIETSEDSESSEEIENLEDVERLVVESSSGQSKTQEPKADSKPEEEAPAETVEQDAESPQNTETSPESTESQKEDLGSNEESPKKEEDNQERMKVLLTGYLDLKTKKELEKAMLNEKKITSQWLTPFREAYQKEWKLEMKKLKLGFQKALDYKKAHIHAIQEERKLLELNHLWADSFHYRTSEELFDFLRMRCEKLKKQYLEELEETKDYYLELEKEIIDKWTKSEERAKVLVNMRKTVHDNILQKTQDTLQNYQHEGEFLRDKEMEMIKAKHITYVEQIAEELNSISPPEHKMEEIRTLFEELKGKYEDFLGMSEKSRRKLEKLGEQLPKLESKVEEARKKLSDMKTENKSRKQREIEEIKRLQEIAKKNESLKPSLRKMVSSSEKVMVQLRERKIKLDKIKKLKKYCDQLEIESDDIYPKENFLKESELQQIEGKDCYPMIKAMCSLEPEDPKLTENLRRKLSKVKLQNSFLQHDIENLRIERMALRSDMKNYLGLISSGDWRRIPDEELQEMTDEHAEEDQRRNAESGKDAIKLLDDKFGYTNKQIEKLAKKEGSLYS